MQRLRSALRLVGAWYRTPVGIAYLALLAGAAVLAAVAGAAWALGVVLVVLAAFVPYKIYREGEIRSQQLGHAVADATAAARRVAHQDRAAALNAVEVARGEWSDILAAERLAWSSAVQHVAAAAGEERTRSAAELEGLRAALDDATEQVESRLRGLEARMATFTAKQDEALHLARAAREEVGEQSSAASQRVDELAKQTRAMVATERSRRSLALARRDADRFTFAGVIVMVTPQRSGSTWLFDMLRCHPDVEMAPTADLFRALGGAGRRYPADLSDTGDASLDIETSEGVGASIPAFAAPARFAGRERSGTLAIEKLHPMVLGFDAAAFADRVSAVAAGLPAGVQPLYLVREPAASLRSFLSYQQRSPRWHADLDLGAVLDVYVRSYEMIAELAVKRPGVVVTYDQLGQPAGLLTRLYRLLSPDLDREAAAELAVHAIDATRRDQRSQAPAGAFFAAGDGGPSEMDLLLGSHAEDAARARGAFDRCRELYRGIAEVAERQSDEDLVAGAPG